MTDPPSNFAYLKKFSEKQLNSAEKAPTTTTTTTLATSTPEKSTSKSGSKRKKTAVSTQNAKAASPLATGRKSKKEKENETEAKEAKETTSATVKDDVHELSAEWRNKLKEVVSAELDPVKLAIAKVQACLDILCKKAEVRSPSVTVANAIAEHRAGIEASVQSRCTELPWESVENHRKVLFAEWQPVIRKSLPSDRNELRAVLDKELAALLGHRISYHRLFSAKKRAKLYLEMYWSQEEHGVEWKSYQDLAEAGEAGLQQMAHIIAGKEDPTQEELDFWANEALKYIRHRREAENPDAPFPSSSQNDA
jgi:hypothetical protein